MPFFRKAALKAGQTYHSPDGQVKVTPQRLAHWKKQFQRLSRAGYTVPVHWDHSDDPDKAQPVRMNRWKAKRTSRNNAGRLHRFNLDADGQGAVLVLKIHDPKAARQADANDIAVSPVIFDDWQDGRKQKYRDLITHVDLVDHPVDYSQGPFQRCGEPGTVACSTLRMGLDTGNPQTFRLHTTGRYKKAQAMAKKRGTKRMQDTDLPEDEELEDEDLLDEEEEDEYEDEDLTTEPASFLGDDDDEDYVDEEEEDEDYDDEDLESPEPAIPLGEDEEYDDEEDDELDEYDEEDVTEMAADSRRSRIMSNLEQAGIVPPEGVDPIGDPEGFIDQLSAALAQYVRDTEGEVDYGEEMAYDDEEGMDYEDMEEEDEEDEEYEDEYEDEYEETAMGKPKYSNKKLRTEAPNMATMSVEMDRLKKSHQALEQRVIHDGKKARVKAIRMCVDQGKMTPKHANAIIKQLTTTRMGLDANGNLQHTSIDDIIAFAQTLPEGAVWGDKKRMAVDRAKAVDPPEHMRGDRATSESIEQHIKEMDSVMPGLFAGVNGDTK